MFLKQRLSRSVTVSHITDHPTDKLIN
jgi:hypothetical protein